MNRHCKRGKNTTIIVVVNQHRSNRKTYHKCRGNRNDGKKRLVGHVTAIYAVYRRVSGGNDESLKRAWAIWKGEREREREREREKRKNKARGGREKGRDARKRWRKEGKDDSKSRE